MKRGQITIFVIIGLVILILVTLLFVFRENLMEQASKVGLTETLAMSKEARQVQTEMESCIKNLAETGIIIMGLQGGYTELDERIQHTDTRSKIGYLPYSGTAYMYYKGKNTVPGKETMEKQLASFIEDNSLICEKQYPGMEITYGKTKALVKINEDNLQININSDVRIEKEQKESRFNSLDTEVKVRLGRIRNVLSQISEEQIKTSKEEICISCISRIAAENNMEINIDRVGEDIFYVLTDKKSKILNYDYIFLSANRF